MSETPAHVSLCTQMPRDGLTLCTAVRVDGPYQNELGGGVGHIAEDVEEVEPHDPRRYAGGYTAHRQPGGADHQVSLT